MSNNGNKKWLIPVIAFAALAAMFTVPSFASSGSWSVIFSNFRNPVIIYSGSHSTANQNPVVSLTRMGGSYTSMYAYIQQLHGNWNTVTQSVPVYLGTSRTIPYSPSVPAGRPVRLVGGNNKISAVNVSGSGAVDFK